MGRIERGEAFAFRQLSTRLQVLLNRAPLPMYADALEFDGAEENGSSPLPRLQTPLWAVALSPATLETAEAILVVDRTDPTPELCPDPSPRRSGLWWASNLLDRFMS